MKPTQTRRYVSTGTPWEKLVGYSRAVRTGKLIFVAGTTASDESGAVVAPGDPGGQTAFILRKIDSSLRELDSSLGDVVRTRIYVTEMAKWKAIGKALAHAFGERRPAATMVEIQALADPGHLVEIEVDAVVDD